MPSPCFENARGLRCSKMDSRGVAKRWSRAFSARYDVGPTPNFWVLQSTKTKHTNIMPIVHSVKP